MDSLIPQPRVRWLQSQRRGEVPATARWKAHVEERLLIASVKLVHHGIVGQPHNLLLRMLKLLPLRRLRPLYFLNYLLLRRAAIGRACVSGTVETPFDNQQRIPHGRRVDCR